MGRLWYRGVEVKGTNDLLAIYDYNATHGTLDKNFYDPVTGIVRPDSKELFEIIFIKGRAQVAVDSGNNIFDLTHEFGVRRVPNILAIKGMISD